MPLLVVYSEKYCDVREINENEAKALALYTKLIYNKPTEWDTFTLTFWESLSFVLGGIGVERAKYKYLTDHADMWSETT